MQGFYFNTDYSFEHCLQQNCTSIGCGCAHSEFIFFSKGELVTGTPISKQVEINFNFNGQYFSKIIDGSLLSTDPLFIPTSTTNIIKDTSQLGEISTTKNTPINQHTGEVKTKLLAANTTTNLELLIIPGMAFLTILAIGYLLVNR